MGCLLSRVVAEENRLSTSLTVSRDLFGEVKAGAPPLTLDLP
jgi:hypothetical protein